MQLNWTCQQLRVYVLFSKPKHQSDACLRPARAGGCDTGGAPGSGSAGDGRLLWGAARGRRTQIPGPRFQSHHRSAAACVISVCTAADARVPQLAGSFHNRGHHQGRKDGREGPTFPSDASPTLCCSRNLIQPLTKYT